MLEGFWVDMVFFLILFPFIAAIVLLLIRSDNVRSAVVGVSALLIAVCIGMAACSICNKWNGVFPRFT